ncbi:MAG TPA: ATP-binding protein [Acidimicrobiia bacterium]|nr:ATP-binding protein [Acidimicrobiia bacterium]
MSTSTSIVSLAADLVVFLAAASLLFVLVLRSDLLGVTPLFRAVLAGAASLLAATAMVHGGFSEEGTWLSTVRLAAIVLLSVGCLGVTARWPRTALLASLALLVVAEISIRNDVESFGNLLRFLGGCGIGLSLWLAARRSLATRIAAAAAILLVTVVLVLSGVLSQVLTNSVSQQALVRAKERAGIEAGLVSKRADVALSQASFIAKVLSLAQVGQAAIKAEDPVAIDAFLNQLKSLYSQVDFLAFLGPDGDLVGRTDLDPKKAGAFVTVVNSATVHDAYNSSLQFPAAGIEPTLNAGLVALGVDFVRFPDDRGVPKVYGSIVAGFFIDPAYLQNELANDKNINLSIISSIRLLATTLPAQAAQEPTDLLDGKEGERLITEVFSAGKSPAEKGRFDKRNAFLAIAPIQISSTPGSGPPKAALAVTVDGSVIDATRTDLFHKLFLVALAAALLALALAAAAGSRLGAPLRKLAVTASQISRGDLSVRSGLRSSDEIGLLGASFDEMAGSIERMASELREGSAQMEAVLNSMTDALVAADPLGLVAMMNPAAEAMLGVRSTREMGKPVGAVIRAEDRNGNSLADRFELPNFEAWSAVGYLQTRDSMLPVALSGAPIRSEQGGVLGAVYVLRDMRRELEIERAKTEFLSNISHELRTPLTPIKGYAEMLRRDQQMAAARQLPPEKRRAFLDGILESSERLERTVDILVNFAAMEAGRLVLRTEPVDSASLVHEVCEKWRSRSGLHRVEELVQGRPRVLADRRLLERSIDELIDNAVKFSPEGGVVTVRTELVGTGDGRAVEISVSDEGIGIAPADFDRIFTDFSQIDGSATRRYGGLGLGLPFVQRVVAAHGGALRATSEPGQGSTFTMELPITAGARGNGSGPGGE